MRGTHFYANATIPELYDWFAAETAGHSPTWERLCRWIADTPPVFELLDSLPGMKRQPNLFLAALRFHNAPLQPGSSFVRWTTAHWAQLRATILSHTTQTNEPGRCATLLPLLAALPQPLMLIEVGSSAGLCLYPDRYRYRYTRTDLPGDGEVTLGPPGAPELKCTLTGIDPPEPTAERRCSNRNRSQPARPHCRRALVTEPYLAWTNGAGRTPNLLPGLSRWRASNRHSW